MKKRASYISILFIALISVMQSMAQSSQPDEVCIGTTKHYFVDATLGSSYIWKINEGTPEASTTNSLNINWTTPGIYTLTVQEITKDNCLGQPQFLQVTVIESPTLQLTSEIGTESQKICLGSEIKQISYSFGGGATGVTVTGLPDGINYVVNGTTVTLSGIPTASANYTITTVGGAPCAVASLNGSITVNQLSTATINGITSTCQNAASPVVTFTGAGGAAPYTFTYNINDGTNKTVTTTTGDTVTVSVPTTVSGIFAYNLVDVTDSNGCTNAQTGTAIISIDMPTYSTTKRTVCPMQIPFSWNGIECSDSGTYHSTNLKNAAGCDSIATLELTVLLPKVSVTRESICQGESYEFNGQHITTPGNYTFYLQNALGCDSTAHLILTVNSPSVSVMQISISEDDLPFIWNESSYFKPGRHESPKRFINCMGCDSIAILALRISKHQSSTISATICDGESYIFNGEKYSESGTYSVTLFDSEGFDSIASLELTVNQPTRSLINKSICQDESYVFNGVIFNAQGTYTDTLINVAGCDSIVTIELTVNIPTTSYQTDTICSSLIPYRWDGLVFNEAGTKVRNLINAAGCDSTATYELIVKQATQSLTRASVCKGDSLLFNGKFYNSTGVFSASLTNTVGCDSTAILELTVNNPTVSLTKVGICQSESYSFNGKSYNSSGTYYVSLTNSVGCDSIAILDLLVKLQTSSVTKETICQGESYLFNGKSYDSSGTYYVSLLNSVGCDSLATLELAVIQSSASITKRVVCPLQLSFKWNGISCPNAGTYTVRLINANGCDSIATLELLVQSPITSTIEMTLCSSELPYKWNDYKYTNSGVYQAFLRTPAGCDSIATLVLNVISPTTAMKSASFCEGESYQYNGKLYSAPGSYDVPLQGVNGCDSIVTLVLKQNTGSYTSQAIRLFSGETYSINGETHSEAGVYTDVIKVAGKCDDIVVTDLSFIEVPNTLTPNDGKNNLFMPGYHVQIFNRNGIKLYDGLEGWNGKYKNKTVSKDTYFYVLYYNSESSIKSKEGYIMVIP